MDKAMKKAGRDHRQLQQIIAGLSQGIVLVDLDQSILWANEAAIGMHGVKRLKDLGAMIDEYRQRFRLRYRNNHPLDDGEHPIARVVAGEESVEVTVEVSPVDYPETSWVHAIRCFVITDDDDEPDYLVLVIGDESKRFEAEERFESAFNANPAPAIICRLADLRYIKVNQGFLEMTGYAREDVIGRSIYEVDVLAEADQRELALERLNEGRTVPQMEACMTVPDGSRKYVIVAGEPIEIKEESCMLFTFADLNPRKKAETALKQSEERFAKSFQLSPVATAICVVDGLKFIEANDAYKKLTGYSDEEIIGRSPAELGIFADRAGQKQFDQAMAKGGGGQSFDLQVKNKDGALVDCVLSAEPVAINERPCILFALQDITERKRSQDELVKAIEAVMADTSWFSQGIVEKMAALRQSSRPTASVAALDEMTKREREILGLVCEGRSDREMSEALKLSPNTIRNHVASLYRKIGVNRRSAVVIWARERGITGPSENAAKKPAKR